MTESVARVRELAGQVLRTTEQLKRPDLESRVTDELGRFKNTMTTVVVAGEVKRGKSSLINALVDAPGTLPVGVDVATNVRVAVAWRDEPGASVQTADGVRDVPLDELTRWASEDENPGNAAGVVSVAVGLPAPLLADNLVLLDTPGLNSRLPGHQAVALSALGATDAVLYVIDPDTETTAAELDFLRAATTRVGVVLLAVTKADLPHADDTLRRTETILRREIPELQTVHATTVSSALVELAHAQRAAGADDIAAALTSDSGITGLRELLHDTVASRGTQIRIANLIWVCSRVVEEMHDTARAELATLEDMSASEEALNATRRSISQLAADESRWRRELSLQVQRIERDARSAASRAFLELRHKYQMLIAESPGWTNAQLLDDLDRALDALYGETAAFVSEQLAVALQSVADVLADQGVALDELRPAPALRDQLRVIAARPAVRQSAAEQMINYMPSIYAPAALSSVAGAAATVMGASAAGVSAVLAPIAIPIMAGMLFVRTRVTRAQTVRRQATEALQEAVAIAKDGPDGLLADVSRMVATVGADLQQRISERLEARRTSFTELLDRQTTMARADTAQRRRRGAELQQQGVLLRRLADAATTEYRRVQRAGVPTPIAAPTPIAVD